MATKTLQIPGFGVFTYDDSVTPNTKLASDGVVQFERTPTSGDDAVRLTDLTLNDTESKIFSFIYMDL